MLSLSRLFKKLTNEITKPRFKIKFNRSSRRRFRLTIPLLLLILILLPAIFFTLIHPRFTKATWYDGAWKYRKSITFNNADQNEDLVNFPVMIKLASENFDFSQTQSEGQDIRFTDTDNKTLLSYEIEKYDPNNQEAVIWVNIPQIDASSSTDSIYMYWGNPQAANAQAVDATWNSNYKGVYHLSDDSANTIVTDSSGNDNNLTASANTNNQYASASGKIAGSFLGMGAPQPIPDLISGVNGISSDIVIDSNNYPVIAYYDNTNGDLVVVHCNDKNCSGQDESIEYPDIESTTGNYPSIQLDSSGYPVIAYYDASTSALNLLHCGDANCSSGNTITTIDSTNVVGLYPELVLDSNDYPAITYYDSTNTDLKFVHCNDVNCSGGDDTPVVIDGSGFVAGNGFRSNSITLDQNDYPVIAYYDNTNTDLKFVHCNDINCSGGDDTPTTLDSTGDVGHFGLNIYLNANGHPIIGYEDYTNHKPKLLNCNDANCSGGNDIPITIEESSFYYPSFRLDNNGLPVFFYSYGSVYPTVIYCADTTCSSHTKTTLNLYSNYKVLYPQTAFDSNNNLFITGYTYGKDKAYDISLFSTTPKLTQNYDPDFDFNTDNFSVSLWFKTNYQQKTQHQTLLSRYDADQGFKIWLDGAAHPCFGIDNDSSWGPDDRVCANATGSQIDVDSGSSSLYIDMVLDSSDYPVIASYNSNLTNLEIIRCSDYDCSGNKTKNTVDSTGTVGYNPSIALDSNSYPVIAYQDVSNLDLKLVHCGSTDCSSGNSVTTIDGTDAVGYNPSLVLDSSGYPVIGYYDNTNTAIKLVHCNDANCVGSDESIVTVDNNESDRPYVAFDWVKLDANGYPVLAYTNMTSYDLKVAHCTDTNCTNSTINTPVTTGTTGYFPSLELNANGYPVVAFYNASYLRLELLHCNDPNCAGGDETLNIACNDYQSGYHYINLNLNSSGYPVISHTSLANWSQVLTTCNDIYCAGGDENHTLVRQYYYSYHYNSAELDSNNYPVIIQNNAQDLTVYHPSSTTYQDTNSKDDGTWHHVVAVKNGLSSISLYVDGELIGQDTNLSANSSLSSDSAPLGLAAEITNSLSTYGFDGWIDEVQIDSTARSDAWVAAQYLNENNQFITIGSTETSPENNHPMATWHLDENQGQIVTDSSPNKHSGTLGADSSSDTDDPTWINDSCVKNACLSFDGINDYVNINSDINNTKSVSFWIKPISTTTNILTLNDSTYITASSGTLSATGFSSATIYVNGVPSDTITANNWQHITITSTENIPANTITLGKVSSSYFSGFMDEINFFPTTLTAADVLVNYNQNAAVSIGLKNEIYLSDGLIAYWKTDETSSPSLDSSGNGHSATWQNDTTHNIGKFNQSLFFDGDGDYAIATLDGTSLSDFSYSFWLKTDSVSGTTGVFQWADTLSSGSPTTYVQRNEDGLYVYNSGAYSNKVTITADTWYHFTYVYKNSVSYLYQNGDLAVTFNRPMSSSYRSHAASIYLGNGYNGYFDGSLDEVRVYNRALSQKEISDLYRWAPGPVAHWNMDEKSGNLLNDLSGNGKTLTLYNSPTWTSGKFGSALSFNGTSNQYAGITDSGTTSLDITGNLTFEAWVYWNQFKNYGSIFQKGIGDSSTSFNYALWSYNNQATCFIGNGSTTISTSIASSQIPTGTWHHFACVADGTNLTPYLNGKAYPGTSQTITPTANDSPFSISESTYSLDGKVDDVRIYNYARTPQQIMEDLNATHPAPATTPLGTQIAYWKFDEQFGQTINNTISGAANGTLGATSDISTDDPTWKTGSNCKLNGCLYFDGGDYVLMDSGTNYSNTQSHTYSAWVKLTANPASYAWIINNGGGNTGTSLIIRNVGGNVLKPAFFYNGGASVVNGNTTLSLNTWYQLTTSYDTNTAKVSFYIDGKFDSTSNTLTSWNSGSTAFRIGSWYTPSYYPTGLIDEVKIYNSALTADQVKLDYNFGSSLGFSTGQNEADDLTDGAGSPPILYWNFDEKSDTTANDKSGNNYSGTTFNSPEWTTGKIGSALKFDGLNDHVSTATSNPFEYTDGNITFETWFYHRSADTDTSYLFSKAWNGNGQYNYRIYFSGNTDNIIVALLGSTAWSTTTANTFTDDTWHHLAVTLADDSSVKIYVDGKLEKSDTHNITSWVPSSDDSNIRLSIGSLYPYGNSWAGVTSYSFQGLLDEIKIYDYVRTPTQIAYDYNRGAPIAHWRLDECSGTTINDSTGNIPASTLTVTGQSVGTCDTTSTAWGTSTGKFGGSVYFDGDGDFITVLDNNIFSFGDSTTDNPFSLSIWVKPTSISANKGIISKASDSNAGEYYLYTNSSNSLYFRIIDNSTGGYLGIYASNAFSVNNWSHVIATYDGTGQSGMKIYLNGILQNTTTSSSGSYTAMENTSTDLLIGKREDSTNYNGQIDDVHLYNYALSPQQIKIVMNEDSTVRFAP